MTSGEEGGELVGGSSLVLLLLPSFFLERGFLPGLSAAFFLPPLKETGEGEEDEGEKEKEAVEGGGGMGGVDCCVELTIDS